MAKNNHSTAKTVLALGAGIAAIGATTYYFFSPQGKKNQKKLKGWMIKMKGEVIEKIEDSKEVTENAYHDIIDNVMKTYKSKIDTKELEKFADNLKGHWHEITKIAKGAKGKSAKAKKAANK